MSRDIPEINLLGLRGTNGLPLRLGTFCAPQKVRRKRRPSLAGAMKQAAKAGVHVAAAMFTPEGLKLELGESQNGQTSNPWDAVQ